MIDIHSHILPMIDDGATSVDHALEMLAAAYQDGTDKIVLTPHLAYEYGFINPNEKIIHFFRDLKYIVANERIPIELYLGTEFLYSSKETFEEHIEEITTMNDTKYLLMEFFFDVDERTILEAIKNVQEHQLIPIIAHPERYDCVQATPFLPKQMVQRGALLQMNKASIFGRYGKFAQAVAFEMLDEHLVHFVGSDAHHPQRRTPLMYESFCMICDHYGEDYAREIFDENARKMLKNIDIRKRNI